MANASLALAPTMSRASWVPAVVRNVTAGVSSSERAGRGKGAETSGEPTASQTRGIMPTHIRMSVPRASSFLEGRLDDS